MSNFPSLQRTTHRTEFDSCQCMIARTALSAELPSLEGIHGKGWSHSVICVWAMLLILFTLAGRLFAAGERGVAATIHPLATDAAIKAMKEGGNAIDGVVAASLTLGVVAGHNSGIGGGCFMLIRTK